MAEYSDKNNPKYHAMVKQIHKNLDMKTLKFQKLDDLVEAIGLPKEKLCTHCWDGSSYFQGDNCANSKNRPMKILLLDDFYYEPNLTSEFTGYKQIKNYSSDHPNTVCKNIII